jgi:hypothetical protein
MTSERFLCTYTFIRIPQILKIQSLMAAVVTESGLRDPRRAAGGSRLEARQT